MAKGTPKTVKTKDEQKIPDVALKDGEVMIDGEKAIVETAQSDLPKENTLIDPSKYKIEDFINILLALRTTIKTVATAPTAVPRSFSEQLVIYSSGGTFKLYVYIVGIGWKSVALT